MRRLLLIGAAVAIGATAVVARHLMGSAPTPAGPISASTATTISSVAAVTRPSAEAAAVVAVRATGQIARAGFIERRDLVGALASTRFAPTLTSSSAAQLSQMTLAIGAVGVAAADVLWHELPLTVRVVSSNDTVATVEVWSVLIVGVPGHGAPRQVWRTVTMTFVWERDRWRIDSWTTVAGPTPALASAEPISDVAEVAKVLGWSSVGGEG